LPHRPQEIEIVLGVNALKRLKPVGNGGDDLSNPRIPNPLEDKPRPLGFLEAGNQLPVVEFPPPSVASMAFTENDVQSIKPRLL
jgi:hypothetical protein